MNCLKASIIGAGRNRNGTGKYIANYFQKAGVSVTSVLGTTEKTALNAAFSLREYGIKASSHTDFNIMVEKDRPDMVAIASPFSTHYDYIMKALRAGLHIFCEKPFIWQETENIAGLIETIFNVAESKGLTIAMNSQWPFSIPCYEELCGKIDRKEINNFYIRLSPISAGREMVIDSVPHALSILYYCLGKGEIENVLTDKEEDEITIRFNYIASTNPCNVLINLKRQDTQPRDFSFGFNDKIVSRILDLESYSIFFKHKNKIQRIVDPLELSVNDFVESVSKKQEPLIGKNHVVNTTCMLKNIYDLY